MLCRNPLNVESSQRPGSELTSRPENTKVSAQSRKNVGQLHGRYVSSTGKGYSDMVGVTQQPRSNRQTYKFGYCLLTLVSARTHTRARTHSQNISHKINNIITDYIKGTAKKTTKDVRPHCKQLCLHPNPPPPHLFEENKPRMREAPKQTLFYVYYLCQLNNSGLYCFSQL